MPKTALYALIWSPDREHHALQSHGQPEQYLRGGDEPAFALWLETHTPRDAQRDNSKQAVWCAAASQVILIPSPAC